MNVFKKLMLLCAAATAATPATEVLAEAPAGYYSSCENKGGQALLTALFNTITNHTVVSYDGLIDLYKTSDVYPDGKIWDMYSTKHWNPGEKCGNYSIVGDCYNREHSMPKSWFNDASPMYSDAFHLYPTDGKVNGQRSNYPYGECANGTSEKANGSIKPLGKLGTSTFPGYSGKVFEPDDEYKGDFARSYFYMAACYNDRISSWSSDMLAKNKYPVFTTWALNLLLKWHEMDPVSQKELDRQEAVYKKQRNRNPFIDHPELVDFIWGDRKNEKWTADGAVKTVVNQPANGSTIDLGVTAAGFAVEKTVHVLTTNANTNVGVAVSGSGFSVSPASLSAATANAGADVTVKFLPATTGSFTGTLTVSAGEATNTVSLTAKAVDGLPVGAASQIADDSFTVNWTYVGDADAAGCYTLLVADDAGALEGYPKAVDAKSGRYTVEGLMPDTDYSYKLSSSTMTSDYFFVRTAEAIPSIDFYFDGELAFNTKPGEPSDAVEVMITTDNIEGDYELSVKAPFEISFDLSDWRQKLTLSPDDSRVYLRFNSDEEGTFNTSLTAVWGDYVSDDAAAIGTASSSPSFIEDFEATGEYGTYKAQVYSGNACDWNLNNAGIWDDPAHSGDQALRVGRDGTGEIEMATDRQRGIGKVSFWARRYQTDPEAEYALEYSTDGGNSYTPVTTFKISGTTYAEYTAHVGVRTPARIRIMQKSGKRILIDDIAITDATSGLDDPAAERHQWAAYSRDGILTVDLRNDDLEGAVYCVDGTTLFAGRFKAGINTFEGLRPGMVCIVHIGDFSRTVVIR